MVEPNRIVLNTLIAQAAHDQGVDQITITKQLLGLGITNFELRREYLRFTLPELAALNQLRLANRLTFFLSVPADLFVDGHVTQDLLQYVAEAQALGVSYLKFNLGQFTDQSVAELPYLAKVVPDSIQLNIENDQTIQNATLAPLLNFFKVAKDNQVNIGFVNDLGNWVYTNQDEDETTKALLPYTRYVHLKGYQVEDGKPTTTSFVGSQLDWQNLLKQFDQTLPIALEYPVEEPQLTRDLTTLKDFDI